MGTHGLEKERAFVSKGTRWWRSLSIGSLFHPGVWDATDLALSSGSRADSGTYRVRHMISILPVYWAVLVNSLMSVVFIVLFSLQTSKFHWNWPPSGKPWFALLPAGWGWRSRHLQRTFSFAILWYDKGWIEEGWDLMTFEVRARV